MTERNCKDCWYFNDQGYGRWGYCECPLPAWTKFRDAGNTIVHVNNPDRNNPAIDCVYFTEVKEGIALLVDKP